MEFFLFFTGETSYQVKNINSSILIMNKTNNQVRRFLWIHYIRIMKTF